MTKTHTKYRFLTFALGLIIALGALVWSQAPATAQEPEGPSLSIQVAHETDGLGIAGLKSKPSVNVGDKFRVSVVALSIGKPGIFGSQFKIQYDISLLSPVTNTLVSGSALEPVVNPIRKIDRDNGLIEFAASRQGDLDNLSGDVVLATLSFEAIAPTEPPEGQSTTIDLQDVKLGAKGGTPVQVSGIVDLDIIIKDTVPGKGDIVGKITVQGRQDDNQAGHNISATINLTGQVFTDTTEINGDFWINDPPAATYNMVAESPGFLDATCTGVIHTNDTLNNLNDATLLAGDIDDNQKIDITDAVAIATAFGNTASGQISDLNTDGQVNILDIILMAVNYDQTSADNPWSCQ